MGRQSAIRGQAAQEGERISAFQCRVGVGEAVQVEGGAPPVEHLLQRDGEDFDGSLSLTDERRGQFPVGFVVST